MSTDVQLDEDYALDWRAAVEQAVTEAGSPDLVDSVPFLARLDPLVGSDPDGPEFGRLVEAAVQAHLAEAGEEPERATESVTERISGRLLEAKGTASDGGRVFRVEIIAAGQSKNGRNYPAHVLESAVGLYEGSKAFDHHRTAQELQSSTISGLVGHYRNVRSNGRGLEGDLHLLPSARHTAEALDASIEAQNNGLPPIVGISHDALTELRPVLTGGKRTQEAVRITKVHSCDVVADPAAGGKATRVLAGGIETEPESNQEEDVTLTSEAVLAALSTATDEQIAAAGFKRVSESTTPVEEATRTTEAGTFAKNEFLAALMIERKVEAAGLPKTMAAKVAEALPERITESDVDSQLAILKGAMAMLERADLAPTYTAQVTKESRDKKIEALDGFFQGNGKGYNSFRDAFIDFTGQRPRVFGADFNQVIMRESIGAGAYDSGMRTTESLDSTTWAQALGDSVARQMLADYARPGLQSWRKIVSRTPSITDFRTQRRVRVGGYGLLPTVNQGAPYQPLTSPGDEEATYAVTKRGGTEDLTLEMIANDDVQAIQDIPRKLGRAAAITLYRFVWDMLVDNAATTYDAVALFHSSHANTDTSSALTQTTLSVGRRKMREQAAYGQSTDVLSIVPKFLVVPPELEEIAFQLSTSAVAIPSTPAGPTDTPNLHQGIEPIIIDYFTDANDWFLIADPGMVPTIEIGFYLGRQEPELFTQSDPNQGSAFSSDVQTWKIRHIYNGATLDHRGMYRGQG